MKWQKICLKKSKEGLHMYKLPALKKQSFYIEKVAWIYFDMAAFQGFNVFLLWPHACEDFASLSRPKLSNSLSILFSQSTIAQFRYIKILTWVSPHTPCGRVRLARFTLEDHAYGASRLPKTTVLQSRGLGE